MKSLNEFKKNITSQSGEDGIILEILKRIGHGGKFCVEFGAGNGIYFSNTWNLVNNFSWKALYIEPDMNEFAKLNKLYKSNSRVVCRRGFISPEGANSLDNVLERNKIPSQFDVLSIDVDGNDYHIWKSLKNFKPRVVIIENNPTMPPEVEFVGPVGNVDIGSSAKSLCNLAKIKGYTLVAHTGNNCIFVRKDCFSALKTKPQSLAELFNYYRVTYLISTFDGRRFAFRDLSFGSPHSNIYFRTRKFIAEIYKPIFRTGHTKVRDIYRLLYGSIRPIRKGEYYC